MHVSSVRRAIGQCATAVAARRSGTLIVDERTGQRFDCRSKARLAYAQIVLPKSVANCEINWALERSTLWKAPEQAKGRKDARTARENRVAFSHELEEHQRVDLARTFASVIAGRYLCAVDLTVHMANPDGDMRNHHASMLTTPRQVSPNGLGQKPTIELSGTDRRRLELCSGPAEG